MMSITSEIFYILFNEAIIKEVYMEDWSILKWIGVIILIWLVGTVGLEVFVTLYDMILAVAGTWLGAIILLIIGIKVFKELTN